MNAMSLSRFVGPLAFTTLLSLTGFGCVSASLNKDEKGAAVSGTMTYTTEDGTGKVSANYGGKKLPAGWPKDFPIMPGLTLENSSEAAQGTGSVVALSWTTKASVQDVLDFYKKALANSAYEVTATTNYDSIAAVGYVKKSDNHYAGSVSAERDGDGPVNVAMTYMYTKDLADWGTVQGAPTEGDE